MGPLQPGLLGLANMAKVVSNWPDWGLRLVWLGGREEQVLNPTWTLEGYQARAKAPKS